MNSELYFYYIICLIQKFLVTLQLKTKNKDI
jgi:hypothetical protein